METQFLLSEQVYARAKVEFRRIYYRVFNITTFCFNFHGKTLQQFSLKVPPTDKVCLWLGANVMLEYTLDDAEVLLKKNCEQVY